MEVRFNTNRAYKPQFGNATVTEKATMHLKTRFMSAEDIERFEKVLTRFKEKGELIKGALDEVNGDLTASIYSEGRYSETITEGWFSHLFRSPIYFIENWANKADKIETKIKNDIKIENLAHNSQ